MAEDDPSQDSEPRWRTCRELWSSAFMLFRDEELTRHADLTNPIHPLFRQSNFSIDFDYSVLKPTIRLVSRLVESDALVPYVNTVFDGQIIDSRGRERSLSEIDTKSFPGPIWDHDAAVFPKLGQDHISRNTRRRAKRILRAMAGMVHFSLTAPEPENASDGKEDFRLLALTEPLYRPLTQDLARHFSYGCRSLVTITREMVYERLKHAEREKARLTEREYEEQSTDEELLLLRLNFAIDILHELGHGFEKAAHGHRLTEIYYKNSPISEAGFEMTAQIFGGPPDQIRAPNDKLNLWGGKKRMMTLREWPSELICQHYKQSGNAIAWKGHRNFDLLWRIPFSYVESIFTDELWKRRDLNADDVRPRKIASWPFEYVERKKNLSPMAFSDVVKNFGWPKAQKLCSCAVDPKENFTVKESLDAADIWATRCPGWFDEKKEVELTKDQRKSANRRQKAVEDDGKATASR